MQVPLKITYRNYEKSQAIEDAIRGEVADLEEIYDRIISCIVRVEQRQDNEKHSIPPVVRIELSIPHHKNLVVAHEPDHLQRKFQDPDIRNAINEAFRIAEDRLRELKEMRANTSQQNGSHESDNEFLGQVAEMHPENDHGFLLTKEGGLLYFHRNSILRGDFDGLKRGDEVHYVEEDGDTGPLASKVRVKRNGNGNGH